jgi:D-tyrosyl-tRNA(Tyr) deacylase
MRTVIQRVSRAQAWEGGASKKNLVSIPKGLFILAGFEEADSPIQIEQMVQKLKSLRIFSDADGRMNLAGPDVGAHYLLTSQFTLYADCKYGNRPSFTGAATKPRAKEYYEHFAKTFLRILGQDKVQFTAFGTDLSIELVNEGPVTLFVDSRDVI